MIYHLEETLMKKLIMLLAVLFVASLPAHAQTDYPGAEIFGGYSYFNTDFGDRESQHGWGASFTGNLGPRVGLVAEFSGNYKKIEGFLADFDTRTYTYLFGPRFSYRTDAATVFGHILVGGATTQIENFSDTNFALAAGGGVDINVNKSFAIRAAQIDYIPIFADDTIHNFRYMGGIVIKF
jgi:hypothetical protein